MPEPVGSVVGRVADFLGPRSLTAITGGGGKTTLMEALAAHLAERATVVVTTTTKLCADGVENVLFGDFGDFCQPDDAALRALFVMLAEKKRVTLANRVQGEKLIGLAPEAIDAMARAGVADHILVEADGAKHLPFKAYESYEPVVPRAAMCQIVVVGAEIFIEPASEKNTFRFDLLRARWGVEPGRHVPLDTLVRIFECRDEYLKDAPQTAKRLLVINKCDLFSNVFPMGSGDWSPAGRGAEPHGLQAFADVLTAYDALMLASVARDECYAYRPLRRSA